jgi:predicted peroxiredoxin
MARILSVATHATDDPTKATLAFITAVGAMGADKECTIVLLGEAVTIVKEPVAKGIHGVGFPALPELIAKVVQAKIPVFV